MPLVKRLLPIDEELGKKDDNHRPTAKGAMVASTFRAWRPRKNRILIGIFTVYILYLFAKYIPTDVPPVSKRIDTRFGVPAGHGPSSEPLGSTLQGPPPRPSMTTIERYYDGPIKFYGLTLTLGFPPSFSQATRNVLFAASSLTSVSHMIPLACYMAKQNRNRVHFAIMGREEITVEDLKRVNGVSDGDCDILWHDGRPDYAPYSTDLRMGLSARTALGHINKFIQPQAVLIDTSAREDDFFTNAINDIANQLGIAKIELPANAIDGLQWMLKLDSDSLSAINRLQIEILIHAPAESSGSLIRLLRSLENADYFGLPYPKLTVELPEHIDRFTANFLSSFHWPPKSSGADSRLTLRRRIHPKRLSAPEASIRTIESYYPALTRNSHVLVLTSQAELAQSYYHYLIFTLLSYKYSSSASSEIDSLFGISLEIPTSHLNGSNTLSPPHEDQMSRPSPFFLWQAPNSNAALYFGDKWVEFHSYLSNRFRVHPDPEKESQAKLVSEYYPAWMEYLLELVRARGYVMLYPSFASDEASAIATVHTDLYQPPEEFLQPKASTPDPSELDTADSVNAEPHLTAGRDISSLRPAESTTITPLPILPLLFKKFTPSLDSGGAFALPSLSDLQILSFAGEPLSRTEWSTQAVSYAEELSFNVGGCRMESERAATSSWTTDDLFCLGGHLDAAKTPSAG